MDLQALRSELAREIVSWRRIRDQALASGGPVATVPGCRWPLVTWEECDWAARGLRGMATLLPPDQAERARRVALARAVHEAAFRGEGADFAAARRTQ